MLKQLKKKLLARVPGATEPVAPPQESHEDVLVNAYCTNTSMPDLDFPHALHGQRSLPDPALSEHLDGFLGDVQGRGDGKMTSTRYHVLRHIQRTRQHVSFTVDDSQRDAVSDWAERANALLFLPDGAVRDPYGRVLVSARDGSTEPAAAVPYPADARARRTHTGAALAGHGFKVPEFLPPVIGESELRPRAPQEVAGRALALFLVAVRAEAIATGAPFSLAELEDKIPFELAHLSLAERTFLATAQPSEQTVTQFAWRYESLFLLEWALGFVDPLPFPGQICDVPLAARNILYREPKEFLHGATLRPASELLDALDLHYRMHWLVRQAQTEGKAVPDGLDGSVIQERCYALNWLVRFEDAEWDDVDTPT